MRQGTHRVEGEVVAGWGRNDRNRNFTWVVIIFAVEGARRKLDHHPCTFLRELPLSMRSASRLRFLFVIAKCVTENSISWDPGRISVLSRMSYPGIHVQGGMQTHSGCPQLFPAAMFCHGHGPHYSKPFFEKALPVTSLIPVRAVGSPSCPLSFISFSLQFSVCRSTHSATGLVCIWKVAGTLVHEEDGELLSYLE